MKNIDKKATGYTALPRENATALYRQIAAHLQESIEAGLYEPSGRLPSEAEIGVRFNVSRVTVRLAFDQLAAEGLIVRRQGKGSYVAGKQVRHGLDNLRSFHESLRQQGLNATMTLLEKKRVAVPRELAGLFPGQPHCLFVRRLHSVDGEPVALGISYLPDALGKVKRDTLEREPAYSQLAQVLGRSPARADMSIRAQGADETLTNILSIPLNHALLVLQRTSYFDDGVCCDRSVFYIRPERYEFNLSCAFKAL
jgi:GntR family transcriptional regulator